MCHIEEPIVVKCVCNATPVTNVTPIQQTVQDTAEAIRNTLDSLSDEIPSPEPSEEEVKEAQGILEKFKKYISGEMFRKDINNYARKYGVSPKSLANNFFEKVLGTISDVSGIVVETTRDAGHNLIDLLSRVAHCAVDVICNVANALVSIVTLNKTCVAVA